MSLLLFAAESTVGPMSMAFLWMFALIIWLAIILAYWQVFVKAGKPGWASIIPIYNLYVMLKVAGRPGWWLLLYFIPIVDVIVHLIVCIDVARSFGKSTTFGVVGLWLFSIIGFMILGYGEATYQKPAAAVSAKPAVV